MSLPPRRDWSGAAMDQSPQCEGPRTPTSCTTDRATAESNASLRWCRQGITVGRQYAHESKVASVELQPFCICLSRAPHRWLDFARCV
jgi:hypothetical protein